MTRVQHRYYESIRSFIEKKGHCPTYEEIGKMVGVSSTGTVHNAVRRLVEQGYLIKSGDNYRNIQIVPEKMHSMFNCDKGHPVIWYISSTCPCCELLQRLKSSRFSS
jgi:SOS-response transcriptional repressor LexA